MTRQALPLDTPTAQSILSRRTCLKVNAQAHVDEQVITQLCELATWAPNHHRTEPWRFAVFSGAGRIALGHAVATALEQDGASQSKIEKARTKYLRSPVVLCVGQAHALDPVVQIEDRDAVAAGIQNLMLGATAIGLASYWASIPPNAVESVARLSGFSPVATPIAFIYLGWPFSQCQNPGRLPPEITWISKGGIQ